MAISLETHWTAKGKEYRLGEKLIGCAAYAGGGQRDVWLHDDVPKGRWPVAVASVEAADYMMLAVAYDMVAGGEWSA